jgi:hypothetical protein
MEPKERKKKKIQNSQGRKWKKQREKGRGRHKEET